MGVKPAESGTNASVHSRFSVMSKCQPFSVPLFSALINTFDTKFLQAVHILCSGFGCDSHNKQACGSPHSVK